MQGWGNVPSYFARSPPGRRVPFPFCESAGAHGEFSLHGLFFWAVSWGVPIGGPRHLEDVNEGARQRHFPCSSPLDFVRFSRGLPGEKKRRSLSAFCRKKNDAEVLQTLRKFRLGEVKKVQLKGAAERAATNEEKWHLRRAVKSS